MSKLYPVTKQKYNSIYMIRNRINGMVYIGRSYDPNARLQNHFSLLKRGAGFKSMQIDYDKYGESSFETEILETHSTNEHDPRKREDYYIEKYNSLEKGYNKRYAYPRGSMQLTVSVGNYEYEKVRELAKSENLSSSKWVKDLILKEIERIDNNG